MPITVFQQNLDTKQITESNGKKYLFGCEFITLDESDPMNNLKYLSIPIDNTNVRYFTWVNEINNILLTAELDYIDINGDISKFFGTYLSFLHVTLAKDTTIKGKKDNSQRKIFNHTFLINNFEIKDRDGPAIEYKLYLISAHWINFIANIEFSNYGSNENKDIFFTMKTILNKAFQNNPFNISCDSSWDNKTSGIQLPYCTTCQTTCMSAIRYLQNRLFYENNFPALNIINNEVANGLSFIIFDEFKNSIKLFNLYDEFDENNIIKADKYGTYIALAGSDSEQFIQFSEQNFKSVVKKSNCQSLLSLFKHKLYKYNFEQNSINCFSDIDSNKLTKVGINANLSTLCSEKLEPVPIVNFEKIKEFLGIDNYSESVDINYSKIGTFDNNDFSIYNNLIENITHRNSLILETTGEISHQPGQLFYIADDISSAKTQNDYDRSTFIDKNRMFTNIFYIFKTRHIFTPGATTGSAFNERLFIARTYNPKIKTIAKTE